MGTCALPVVALVTDGTRVSVFAGAEDKGVVAAPLFGTQIFGAGILVITENGVSQANPCFAVVSYSAGIAILAFTLVEGDILAPIFGEAAIVGTFVVVVTGCFVNVTVAVIVDSIADFFIRY